jgi:hypothetical protein
MVKLEKMSLTDEDFQSLLVLREAKYIEIRLVKGEILIFFNDTILDSEFIF